MNNTKQNTISVRINDDMKNNFKMFCKNSGTTMSKAIYMFIKQSLREDGLPFLIEEFNNNYNNDDNGHIIVRVQSDIKNGFSSLCEDFGITMSMAIKMFILKCLDRKHLPFKLVR